MGLTDRPPPPITVSIPGRGPAPAELLAVGLPPERPTPSRRTPLTGLAAVVVLLGGLAVAADLREPAPPPAPAAAPVGVPGVAALARVTAQDELVTRLLLEVTVTEPGTGRGDTNGSSTPEQLSLVDLTARGFQVRLVDASLPVRLGEVGRFGSGLTQATALAVEVVVTDCAVEVGAQRRISLSLRQGGGPVARVAVAPEPGVVQALDGLVSRTCRRPRG